MALAWSSAEKLGEKHLPSLASNLSKTFDIIIRCCFPSWWFVFLRQDLQKVWPLLGRLSLHGQDQLPGWRRTCCLLEIEWLKPLLQQERHLRWRMIIFCICNSLERIFKRWTDTDKGSFGERNPYQAFFTIQPHVAEVKNKLGTSPTWRIWLLGLRMPFVTWGIWVTWLALGTICR